MQPNPPCPVMPFCAVPCFAMPLCHVLHARLPDLLPACLQRGFTSGESRLAFEVKDALVRLELLGTLYSFCRQASHAASSQGAVLCKVVCCCGGGVLWELLGTDHSCCRHARRGSCWSLFGARLCWLWR
jgi:hypothetical protein